MNSGTASAAGGAVLDVVVAASAGVGSSGVVATVYATVTA